VISKSEVVVRQVVVVRYEVGQYWGLERLRVVVVVRSSRDMVLGAK
jgi:hypothetical protein